MSYEGYEQHICQAGHHFCVGAHYMFDESTELCPYCRAPSVWQNGVDETNCDRVGYIDMNALVSTPETRETCNLGHSHVTVHAVYRIPSESERRELRTYQDEDGNVVPLPEHPQFEADHGSKPTSEEPGSG